MSSKTVTDRHDIPDAMYYVLSNDTFFSGSDYCRGRTNTVILPCGSRAEAETVAANARNRTDQQRVRIVVHKPRLRDYVMYSLLTKQDAARWYEPGGFCRCRS